MHLSQNSIRRSTLSAAHSFTHHHTPRVLFSFLSRDDYGLVDGTILTFKTKENTIFDDFQSYADECPSGRCGQIEPAAQVATAVEARFLIILRYALLQSKGSVSVTVSAPTFEGFDTVKFIMNASAAISTELLLQATGLLAVGPTCFGFHLLLLLLL